MSSCQVELGGENRVQYAKGNNTLNCHKHTIKQREIIQTNYHNIQFPLPGGLHVCTGQHKNFANITKKQCSF